MADEQLRVQFKTRNQRLVLISTSPEGMKLERFVGLKKESEAHIEASELSRDEMTSEGLKEVVEEFRVMKPTVTRKM